MSAYTPLGTTIPSITELQANMAQLLQQNLAQSAQASAPGQLATADLELARSNIKALAFVQAMGLHGTYRYLRDFIARQAIPTQSAGEFLDGWLTTYGLARKPAIAATGLANGTGVGAALLPKDALFQTTDGRAFKVKVDAVVSGIGAFSAQVLAEVAGSAGNLAVGTALNLVSPIAGIDAKILVAGADGIAGGTDIETDEQAIYRLQQRLSNEPRGGCPADYARWALAVPGITRAWGVRNPAGPTSAGVIIMADNNAGLGLPTTGQQGLVGEYIRDPRRGPPDELFVIIPTVVAINITVNLSPDTNKVRASTIEALRDLFFREAVPGGSIPHSHVKEVISSVAQEYNHAIVSPGLTEGGFFTVPSFSHLLALGTVSFA